MQRTALDYFDHMYRVTTFEKHRHICFTGDEGGWIHAWNPATRTTIWKKFAPGCVEALRVFTHRGVDFLLSLHTIRRRDETTTGPGAVSSGRIRVWNCEVSCCFLDRSTAVCSRATPFFIKSLQLVVLNSLGACACHTVWKLGLEQQ